MAEKDTKKEKDKKLNNKEKKNIVANSRETNDKKVKGKESKNKANNIGRIIITTAVICVLLVCGVFGGFYLGFVYSSNRIADKAVVIYASGTGEDLKELIAPGYVKYCEDNFKSMSVEEMQQSHINDFRSMVYDKVGDIDSIEAERKGIVSVSNVDNIADEFAEYGVLGVEKYRYVDMTWHVSGSNGTADIDVKIYILKCEDGWHLDFVDFE